MTTRQTHQRTGKKVLPSQRNHRVSTHLLCPSISLCVIFRSEKRFYSDVSCENYRSGFYGVLLFSYLAGYRQRIRSLPSILQEIWRLFRPLATSRPFLGQGIRADISKHSIQRYSSLDCCFCCFCDWALRILNEVILHHSKKPQQHAFLKCFLHLSIDLNFTSLILCSRFVSFLSEISVQVRLPQSAEKFRPDFCLDCFFRGQKEKKVTSSTILFCVLFEKLIFCNFFPLFCLNFLILTIKTKSISRPKIHAHKTADVDSDRANNNSLLAHIANLPGFDSTKARFVKQYSTRSSPERTAMEIVPTAAELMLPWRRDRSYQSLGTLTFTFSKSANQQSPLCEKP